MLAALLLPCAAAGDEAARLDRIEVGASRLLGIAPFDVPASISTIALDAERSRAGVHLSEALGDVPGLLARERQNFAQDTQIALRGFGARATFGVRGLRLYADGIPATMPDGQGQVSHFSLAGADRVEVLRGPFSALYGNSSGGVIQLWSAEGGAPAARAQSSVGRFDTRAASARVLGGDERVGWNVAASRFDTDGFRDHSAARRTSANARLQLALGERGRLALVFNGFDAPDAKDPLGLTRAQAHDDPRQATAVATRFDTRKSVAQQQAGALFDLPTGGAGTLRVVAHAGRREVEQFLALPVAAQSNPLNAGGVIDLGSDYGGLDARWSWQGALAGGEAEFTLGSNTERQDQQRRGFENFVGDRLGVRGARRRDETNRVRSFDQYAQLWWRFAPRWSLLAGVRHSALAFDSRDSYVTAANPDDSGSVDYARLTPVVGLSFSPSRDLRLHVSSGRGFETPTFNELSYRADGAAGLAFNLRPAVSRNLEAGVKWRSARGASLEAAVFRADTDDELAVARNVAGRSSFRNVGRARREGAEFGASLPLHESLDLGIAWTRLHASFRDAFPLCTGAGCTNPTQQVTAGTRIPGTARDQFNARLDWRPGSWHAASEVLALGPVSVNDTGTESAPGHALLNLELARTWTARDGRWRLFARIDNALDRRYIGSVIVNEGNARYYEPGPDRSWLLGAQWDWMR